MNKQGSHLACCGSTIHENQIHSLAQGLVHLPFLRVLCQDMSGRKKWMQYHAAMMPWAIGEQWEQWEQCGMFLLCLFFNPSRSSSMRESLCPVASLNDFSVASLSSSATKSVSAQTRPGDDGMIVECRMS